MNYRFRLGSLHCLADLFRLAEAAWEKVRFRMHGASMSFAQIVKNGDSMALFDQFLDACGADVAGASSDESVHN